MAQMIEMTGKTVDKAIEAALETLGVDSSVAIIEVLEEGEAGLLGFGRKPARVRVTVEDEDLVAAPPPLKQPADVVLDMDVDDVPLQEEASFSESLDAVDFEAEESDAAPVAAHTLDAAETSEHSVEEIALDYVTAILQGIGIHGRIGSYFSEDGNLHIDVTGRDCGSAIGRHGETLNAIQYLTSLVANRHTEDYLRVIVDIGGYRRRRESDLNRLADQTAERVVRTGKSVRLKPMNAAERRLVHMTLQDFPGITTYSEGEEPERYLVVAPDEDV